MDYLPITIKVVSTNILIVGGGKVATHKAQILARFTDHATVVAPETTEELRALPFQVIEKEFEPSDLDGIQLLFVCTGNHDLNHEIKQLAAQRHILASVCDDPEQCDFISPAIFRSDNITIAVGSDARDVKRSIRIRNRIKELIENGTLQID